MSSYADLYMMWSKIDTVCDHIPLISVRELILIEFLFKTVQLLGGKNSSPGCFLHLTIVSRTGT